MYLPTYFSYSNNDEAFTVFDPGTLLMTQRNKPFSVPLPTFRMLLPLPKQKGTTNQQDLNVKYLTRWKYRLHQFHQML